jgi:S1-C subfamily serine protease
MKRIKHSVVLLIPLVFCVLPVSYGFETEIKKAIVKIYSTQTRPLFDKPWHLGTPEQSSGSGSIIHGNRILTNAHVVSDHTFVQVCRFGESKKYKANVVAVSHETDLALLTVEDKELFRGVTPLSLGELPAVQEEVVVYGFPEGGETICLTRGVISRIEHQEYVHSLKNFLAIQIDAAINPGSSGGPALTGGEIIGVVMQVKRDSENIGYIVPTPIINHFLKDLEDGIYDGFPEDGIIIQTMENEDLKKMYGLKENESGILVTSVIPGSPSEGIIKPRDVIMSIDGHDIADDGTVEFRPDERTSNNYFVQQHQIGEQISLEILRNGKKKKVLVALTKPSGNLSLVAKPQYDTPPTYFIYSGLVFSPLSEDYLKVWANELEKYSPKDLIAYFTDRNLSVEGEEVINLINVLPHDVNNGYHSMSDCIIVEVNGKKVHNLEELIQIVENDSGGKFIEFKTKKNKYIVLDREKAVEAHADILGIYGVTADRSFDLKVAGTGKQQPNVEYKKKVKTEFSRKAYLTKQR